MIRPPTASGPAALAAATLALVCLAASPLAGQAPPLGPLTHEEGSPLHRVALTPAVEGVDPVAVGSWRADVWLGYSNIFEQDSARTHQLFLDLERLITTTTVRYGVAADLEVGARMTLETTGGGVLDSFISGWHQALGLGNANRERYPEGRYAQLLRDGSGEVRLDVPRRTFGLEDVRLFAKLRLVGSDASPRALGIRGVVRIPTAENRAGDERTDAALLLLGRTRLGRLHLHGMAGGSTVRANGALEGLLRDSAWYLTVAAEHPLASWISALGQVSLATSKVRGFENSEVDGTHSSLLLGFGGRVGDGWQWEAGFQEDIPADTPSVDFTLGLGVRRAF